MRHKSEEELAFLDKLSKSPYNPEGLPNDGAVERGDFVWKREGIGHVFFLRRKNPKKRPKGLYDGIPLFVRSSASLKAFGQLTMEDYLSFFAKRFGLSLRRLKKRGEEKIWQFYKPRKKPD